MLPLLAAHAWPIFKIEQSDFGTAWIDAKQDICAFLNDLFYERSRARFQHSNKVKIQQHHNLFTARDVLNI